MYRVYKNVLIKISYNLFHNKLDILRYYALQ